MRKIIAGCICSRHMEAGCAKSVKNIRIVGVRQTEHFVNMKGLKDMYV